MSIFRTLMSAGVIASVAGLSVVTTTQAAMADGYGYRGGPYYGHGGYYHGNGNAFWGGVAAGAVGGIIGGAIVNEARRPAYAYPVYEAPPPPPPVYRTYYRPVYVPSCHYEWRHNEWGDAYRVQVCPR